MSDPTEDRKLPTLDLERKFKKRAQRNRDQYELRKQRERASA